MQTGSKELKSAPIDCQKAAKDVLNSLQKQPIPTILRLHNLKGYSKPTIWKIDIYANKSWGNPPDKPKGREVEFSKKEVLREEVEIYRQPNHGCLETC
ncbi:MAG: hypothetical protein IPJ18_19890 [Betaproteobacteria bacterium]|nr:hypothetical protein [Betaproteobacteria bacterium]